MKVNLYRLRLQSQGLVPGLVFIYHNSQSQTVRSPLDFRSMSDYIHFCTEASYPATTKSAVTLQ